MKRPLHARTILVTRPLGRADKLCQRIHDAGGHALHYPLIAILPPRDRHCLADIKHHLYQFDIAIFISPTAVEQTAELLPSISKTLQIAAIGSKTAAILQQHGVLVSIQTEGHNSESLLTHPALQPAVVSNRQILIFRGEGGRAFLGDSLRQRGAQVRYIETYRRGLPDAAPLSDDTIRQLDAITISSNESLDNLITLMANPAAILNTPIIVASDKTVKNARSYGFTTIYRADNATDEACYTQLQALFKPTE